MEMKYKSACGRKKMGSVANFDLIVIATPGCHDLTINQLRGFSI
jgi:hypothetical protein